MTTASSKDRASILWFDTLGIGDRPSVGGKGASLGEMTGAGLPIPPGFVVSTAAFNLWLDALDAEHGIRERIGALRADDLEAIRRCSEELRELMLNEKLPESLHSELCAAYDKLGTALPVAVRSSATSEDSEEASFAGLQDTYLWVEGHAALVQSVLSCWASLYSVESLSYRRRLELPEAQLAMAVVVQRMVDSACSGVMFTRSPTTGDRSVITIEGSWGLGSSIVGGEVTPDLFVVNKVTGETVRREVADKAVEHVPGPDGGVLEREVDEDRRRRCCLEDAQLRALTALGRRVEQHYGSPQDIEWALDREGGLLLLQSRPETVWAAKDKAPLAKPAASAFDHIFSALGGRK